MANLITITKSTRGKNPRDVSFQGIGKFVTRTVDKESDENGKPLGKDSEGKLITRKVEVQELETAGIITTLEEALELVEGNLQRVLDNFAVGYNQEAYRSIVDRDELDEMFSMVSDEDKRSALKRATRQLMKALNLSLEDAAEMVVSKL